MNAKTKDVLIRALKTFWQAALAYAIPALSGVDFFNGDTTKTVLTGIGVSALAAGLSAAWNGVISPIIEKGSETK